MPSWQAGAPNGPGRMVPDVAANADPNTGYEIYFHGASTVVGGTSAVAPLYSGLFASFGSKLGFVTPELWLNHTCFNDIILGDNGAFRAAVARITCDASRKRANEPIDSRHETCGCRRVLHDRR
jgi:subtilase family serine protease